jgi:hypothetical protein
MSPENNNENAVEAIAVPLPKYVQFNESGKIYKINEAIENEISVTELNKNTFKPIEQSKSEFITRKNLIKNSRTFPLADIDFFRAIQVSRMVKNTATQETYYVLNCNLDEATLRKEGTERTTKIPVEILYSYYEIVQVDIACNVCNMTNLATKRILT